MTTVTTKAVIAAFTLDARARNCSARYIEKIAYTLGFLERARPNLPTTPHEINAFLDELRWHRSPSGAPLADTTHAMVWSMLRTLYTWISVTYPAAPNPMARLRKPKVRAKLPRVLSENDVHRILAANANHPREYAMLHVMLDTMARLGELAPLTWANVKLDGTNADIHFAHTGKQGARSAPINPDTLKTLRSACHYEHLWTHDDGTPLAYTGVRQAFKRALARAGIKGRPHLMRHTAATLFVKNGGSLFTLMRIGGWTTLTSVKMYVHLANADIRDQHQKYSTIARRSTQAGTQLRLLQEAQ